MSDSWNVCSVEVPSFYKDDSGKVWSIVEASYRGRRIVLKDVDGNVMLLGSLDELCNLVYDGGGSGVRVPSFWIDSNKVVWMVGRVRDGQIDLSNLKHDHLVIGSFGKLLSEMREICESEVEVLIMEGG